jgi:predicted ester cyclase
MTRDEVLTLLQRRYDAMQQRNFDALGLLYAPAAKVESPLAGTVIGRQGLIQASENFFSAFPDAVITEEPPVIDGERVAIVASVSGTHVGSVMGLSPTGRPFRFTVAFILELENGLIARERRLYDFTGLLVQIGVLKAKPA